MSKKNVKNISIYSQKLGRVCIKEKKDFPLQYDNCFLKSTVRITFMMFMRKNYSHAETFYLKGHLCDKCFANFKKDIDLTKDLKDDPSDLPWNVLILEIN